MTLKCICHLNMCCTALVICLSFIWIFRLYLRDQYSDYRVELLGLISHQPFEVKVGEMYLRKIETSFKQINLNQGRMQNFELIEMMNETSPNQISDDAVLVVSASYSSVEHTYAHLLEKIQKSNEGSASLPFYLLRKAKSILLQNSNEVKNQALEISQILQYFTNSLQVKRLTILSFEEGSLLTLKALLFIKYETFSILDKLILVNPLNPFLMICHSNSAYFLQEVRNKILRDEARTHLVNKTRIIMINTFNTNVDQGFSSWTFSNSNGESVTFANSIFISSRFLWNVYCFLKPGEYFRFQPFLWILTKMFNEDRHHGPLEITDIRNLLLYRELPITRELSMTSREQILSKCVDFYMESYHYDGDQFNAQCVRILRKQSHYFNDNTTVILKSHGRFEVYGELYEKISPFDTKTKQIIYIMENIQEYRRFFVINRRRYKIQIKVQSIMRPESSKNVLLNFSMLSDTYYRINSKQMASLSMQSILLCPGYTLIFPINFVPVYRPTTPQFIFQLEDTAQNCFIGNDYLFNWLQRLASAWKLGFNIIVFSLFCSHVLRKSAFSRFYYQMVINCILCFIHTGNFKLAENALYMAVVVAIQLALKFVTLLSQMINMPPSLASKIMWSPFFFELLRHVSSHIFISPWKIIGLEFLAGTHKNNVNILFLEFIYILESVVRDTSNMQGLFLLCAWLAISTVEAPSQEKEQEEENRILIVTTGRRVRSLKAAVLRLRKQLVDTTTVCIMSMCLSQSGEVMHYIIDFYIVTQVLFAAHKFCDQNL